MYVDRSSVQSSVSGQCWPSNDIQLQMGAFLKMCHPCPYDKEIYTYLLLLHRLRKIFMGHKHGTNKPSTSTASPDTFTWLYFYCYLVPEVLVLCGVGKGPNQTTLLLLVWLLRQKWAQKPTWQREADFWSIARGTDKDSSSSSLLVTDL